MVGRMEGQRCMTNTRRYRPPLWQSAAACIVANACWLAFAYGLTNEQWLLFWVLFLIIELGAATDAEPGNTFSERWWEWSGVRPLRPGRLHRALGVVPFLVVLALHFAQGGSRWWSGGLAVITTSLWPAAVIVSWWWGHARAWLARRPLRYPCTGKEPLCLHSTRPGAWLHRRGFRETNRLP
jgi:hypothetical protein